MAKYPPTDFVFAQKATGYKNTELAKALGVSYASITKWRKEGLKSCPERIARKLFRIISYGGKKKCKKEKEVYIDVQSYLHNLYEKYEPREYKPKWDWKRRKTTNEQGK